MPRPQQLPEYARTRVKPDPRVPRKTETESILVHRNTTSLHLATPRAKRPGRPPLPIRLLHDLSNLPS
jgi:hypothetical protein